jgi:hypothetical protein
MGFSVFVEMLNLRIRAKEAAPVKLHEPYIEEKGAKVKAAPSK